MVHRREINGTEVNFGNQGALYQNAMTWWDHDTGSVWSQPLGRAILGPRKGAELELLPSTLTPWGSWRRAHPDTLALDFEGDLAGFDLADMVVVVDLAHESVGYPIATLREVGVANDTVGGVPIAVVVPPSDRDRWTVLSRRLDNRTVELRIDGIRLVDIATGTTWDPITGLAVAGPLKGTRLDLLPAFTEFPRNFADHFPEGRIWSSEA